LLVTVILSLAAGSSAWADGSRDKEKDKEVRIYPPHSHPYGKSYGEWAAEFWQWAFALPLEGHPFLDSPDDPFYDFGAAQSGKVWFWSSPDGPITRIVSMPEGKALFLTIRDVEASSLEPADPDGNPDFHGDTEVEQREKSKWWADHIVDVFCIIDGVPIQHLENYRFSTPQFGFTAPTPWIFADTGGTGTSVGDGYFLMLEVPRGNHTIHYGGTFHFEAGELGDWQEEALDLPHDVTIELTVGNDRHNGREDGDCDNDRNDGRGGRH